MLQILRKNAQSIVFQAIVIIIALVFIFWGVGTNLMNNNEAAITVNGDDISFQQFQQAYDRAYERVAQQFGGTIPKGLAEQLNIKQQVIGQLTQEALLRQGGAEMGLIVSGNEILKEIEGMIQFQENGQFSMERYKAILSSNRLSPTKFEKSLRYDLLSDKTINSLTNFAGTAGDFEINDLYNLENETVSISYIQISPTRFSGEIEPQEADLAAWYQENGSRYQTEPMLKVVYLPFSYVDTAARINIEEADITAYYDQHLVEYQIPEKRHARHILFRTTDDDSDEQVAEQRKKAEEVLEKARQGEDFAELAKEYSEGPTGPNGGDLGFFEQGRMVKPFDDAVFAMGQGEISDIVKTDFGFHIIKLDGIQTGRVKTFDEVRGQITQTLKMEQAKPLAFQVANEAYEKIITLGSLSAFVEQNPDTKKIETDFFSKSEPPSGMTTDVRFLDRAFQLKKGELSSLIETAEGYAIISATDMQEPKVPELDEVREKATADYIAEKAREKAKEAAEKSLADLGSGERTFKQISEDLGVELKTSDPFTKAAQQNSLPQELVQQAFRLSMSVPLPAEPTQVGDDFYVFRFIERKPPVNGISEEDKDRYRTLLVQYKQQQVIDAWLRNRQESAKIFINKSLENY